MSGYLERAGGLQARFPLTDRVRVDRRVVSGIIEDAYLEAYKFIIHNELRVNLGVSVYDEDSRNQLSRIMKNTVAARLLRARANNENGFVGKLKKRFSSDHTHELIKAAQALEKRNRVIFDSPNGSTDHFLGVANAAISSLFDDLGPEIGNRVNVETRINPDRLNKWGDHWRPLLNELGVGRRS